jgi:hypothetical protein
MGLGSRITRTACWAGAVIAGFAFGISADHYQHWPLQEIEYLKQYVTLKTGLLQRSWPDRRLFAAVNFDQLIKVRDTSTVTSKQAQLRDYIWGRDQGAQHTQAKPVQAPSAEALSHLGTAMGAPDLSLVVDGRYGYRGEALVWFSKNKADCLLVYAQGHGEELMDAHHRNERQLLKAVLSGGCDVLTVAMPLLGMTQKTFRANTRFGPLVMQTHNNLAYLASDDFNPLSLFFVHIRAAIDELERVGRYGRITMAGLSGGGWTATVYAAIDSRIDASFDVAGSLPLMFHLADPRNAGDWEQTNSGLLQIADYLDLYVLGAAGGRQVELVYNYYDGCCYGGNSALAFKSTLTTAAERLGGHIGVTVDETSFGHEISALTAKRIAALALSGPTRGLTPEDEGRSMISSSMR